MARLKMFYTACRSEKCPNEATLLQIAMHVFASAPKQILTPLVLWKKDGFA